MLQNTNVAIYHKLFSHIHLSHVNFRCTNQVRRSEKNQSSTPRETSFYQNVPHVNKHELAKIARKFTKLSSETMIMMIYF